MHDIKGNTTCISLQLITLVNLENVLGNVIKNKFL